MDLLAADVGIDAAEDIVRRPKAGAGRNVASVRFARCCAKCSRNPRTAAQPLEIPPSPRPFLVLMVGERFRQDHHRQARPPAARISKVARGRRHPPRRRHRQLQVWGQRNDVPVVSQQAAPTRRR